MATIQYVTLALVVISAIYVALTAVATRRFARSNRQSAIINPQSPFTPPVTVLKPVCGVDAEAEENFRSFLEQDYPEFQVIFGALDDGDPALVVARNLTPRPPSLTGKGEKELPPTHSPPSRIGKGVGGLGEIVVTSNPRTIGANLKVSNLHNMMEHARHDILVIADSDMRVTPDYLREVVAPFADENVGLVTCPYRGCMPRTPSPQPSPPGGGRGSRVRRARLVIALHALGITTEFMPSVMVAYMFGMRGFAFGSTIAIRRSVLNEIGSFERLKDHLADDYWLGQLVKRAGYKVVLSHYLVENVLAPESFTEMFKRRLRWARTVKVCQRAGYLGSFVTHLLPLAVINVIAWRGVPLAGQLLIGALLLRVIVSVANNDRCFKDSVVARYWWLTPVNDALSFLVFLFSLLPGPIVWRGQRFRLTREGVLVR